MIPMPCIILNAIPANQVLAPYSCRNTGINSRVAVRRGEPRSVIPVIGSMTAANALNGICCSLFCICCVRRQSSEENAQEYGCSESQSSLARVFALTENVVIIAVIMSGPVITPSSPPIIQMLILYRHFYRKSCSPVRAEWRAVSRKKCRQSDRIKGLWNKWARPLAG